MVPWGLDSARAVIREAKKLKCSLFSCVLPSIDSNPHRLGSGPLGVDLTKAVIEEVRATLRDDFDQIDMRTQKHLTKILAAFRKGRVGPGHFTPTGMYFMFLCLGGSVPEASVQIWGGMQERQILGSISPKF